MCQEVSSGHFLVVKAPSLLLLESSYSGQKSYRTKTMESRTLEESAIGDGLGYVPIHSTHV